MIENTPNIFAQLVEVLTSVIPVIHNDGLSSVMTAVVHRFTSEFSGDPLNSLIDLQDALSYLRESCADIVACCCLDTCLTLLDYEAVQGDDVGKIGPLCV